MTSPLPPNQISAQVVRPLSAAAMALHPAFASVCFEYTDRLLSARRGERLLNQILAQRERELLGFRLLCLHYEALEGGPPPTLSRLAAPGLGSKRRIAAFVGVLRLAGLVRSIPDKQDRRVRILEPTPRLTAMHMEWTRAALRQIDRLLERPVLEQALDRHPRFHRLACLAGAKGIYEGDAFAPGRFALMDFLTPHRSGYLIAASLMRAMCAEWVARGTLPVPCIFALPYGRLARRLGVSRSHVFNVFTEAQARGLLRSDEAGRSITLSAASARDLTGYYAHELAYIAEHSLAAWDALNAA